MIILDNKNTKIKYFINKNIKLFNPNIIKNNYLFNNFCC